MLDDEAQDRNVSQDLRDVIVNAFRDVLRRPDLSAEDDFFEAGGDSLAATALIMALEPLGIQLPVAALCSAPTPAAGAAATTLNGLLHQPSLVTLKAGDEQRPIFIAPGASGSVLELVRTARGIQTERRVYGLQPRDDQGRKLTMDSIEQEAAFYLPLIRAAQPHGPYVLAGYSLGGMVALALAQTLAAAGESVERLIIVDTLTPIEHFPLCAKLRFWLRRASYHLVLTGELPLQHVPRYLAERMKALARDFRPRVPQSGRRRHAAGSASAVTTDRTMMEHAVRVFLAYRPKYFPGSVAFIQSESVDGKVHYPDLLWNALCRHVTVYQIKGDHYAMLSDNPAGVSAAISSALNSAPARR